MNTAGAMPTGRLQRLLLAVMALSSLHQLLLPLLHPLLLQLRLLLLRPQLHQRPLWQPR